MTIFILLLNLIQYIAQSFSANSFCVYNCSRFFCICCPLNFETSHTLSNVSFCTRESSTTHSQSDDMQFLRVQMVYKFLSPLASFIANSSIDSLQSNHNKNKSITTGAMVLMYHESKNGKFKLK